MGLGLYTFFIPDSGGAPITRADNVMVWSLESIVNRAIRLRRVNWGGGDAVAVVMQDRIARHSAIGTGARTAITSDRTDPNMAAAPGFGFITSAFVTTPPAVVNGALLGTPWNAQGGSFWWEDLLGLLIQGAASLGHHHDSGGGAFGSGGAWQEI